MSTSTLRYKEFNQAYKEALKQFPSLDKEYALERLFTFREYLKEYYPRYEFKWVRDEAIKDWEVEGAEKEGLKVLLSSYHSQIRNGTQSKKAGTKKKKMKTMRKYHQLGLRLRQPS